MTFFQVISVPAGDQLFQYARHNSQPSTRTLVLIPPALIENQQVENPTNFAKSVLIMHLSFLLLHVQRRRRETPAAHEDNEHEEERETARNGRQHERSGEEERERKWRRKIEEIELVRTALQRLSEESEENPSAQVH